jgi:hypothetical protein
MAVALDPSYGARPLNAGNTPLKNRAIGVIGATAIQIYLTPSALKAGAGGGGRGGGAGAGAGARTRARKWGWGGEVRGWGLTGVRGAEGGEEA